MDTVRVFGSDKMNLNCHERHTHLGERGKGKTHYPDTSNSITASRGKHLCCHNMKPLLYLFHLLLPSTSVYIHPAAVNLVKSSVFTEPGKQNACQRRLRNLKRLQNGIALSCFALVFVMSKSGNCQSIHRLTTTHTQIYIY